MDKYYNCLSTTHYIKGIQVLVEMMGSFLQIVMVLLVSRLFPQMLVLQSQLSQQQVPPAQRGAAVAEK